MSGASLSDAGCEVLKALAVGLCLRQTEGVVRFEGPAQEPEHSVVPEVVIADLLARSFIERIGQEFCITQQGHDAARVYIARETHEAFECISAIWQKLHTNLR